jgi:hypothetical protein
MVQPVYRPAPEPVWKSTAISSDRLRPFEKQGPLVNAIFSTEEEQAEDPFAFAEERAAMQGRQLDLLLNQLAARHAISYQAHRDLLDEECRIGSKLLQVESMNPFPGYETEFQSRLVREIRALQEERRKEAVACWRDTTRMLSSICEGWTEYAEQARRARLMTDGF